VRVEEVRVRGVRNHRTGSLRNRDQIVFGLSDPGGVVGYNIEWDGNIVTFPPVGYPKGAVSFSSSGECALSLSRYAVGMFNSVPTRAMRISVPVVLIPGPDKMVAVAAPRSVRGRSVPISDIMST
jgi:hypothetical protein